MSDADVPKGKKRPYADKINKFIKDFPDLYYNGAVTICKVCDIKLMCWDKSDCKRHVRSIQHTRKKNGVPRNTQVMFDLLLTLIMCDVPLHILDKKPFKDFWNKYCPLTPLPSRRTLLRYLPTVREDVINKIKCVLKNARLWLCIDETTDIKKNSILNIIVRVLNPLKQTRPLLLASKRLSECTGETITRVVLETLGTFELSKNQVLMLVTDGAATMRLVGRCLQEHGCKMIHVTCKVHALHLVAETIRQCFPNVDALIASTKKVFLKSPKRLRAFHDKCPNIPEPPQPILTRWGTWLAAAFYYAKHFELIKAVVLEFNSNEAAAIKESQAKFSDISVQTDLKIIFTNYEQIHDAIEKLQDSALPLVDSMKTVTKINNVLHTIEDIKNEPVKKKMASVLKKDGGFTRLQKICDDISSEPLSELKEYFNYAPITSVDVERSFSQYKNIFSPKRTSLTETTIETYLMLTSFYASYPMCDVQTS